MNQIFFVLIAFFTFPPLGLAGPVRPDFDGRPEEASAVLEAGELPEEAPASRPEPPAPRPPAAGALLAEPEAPAREPEQVPIKPRETEKDPRRGRDFRRIRPKIPLGPPCPDGGDPPCARERPHPAGSPPRGGYYYGWYRDASDGKLKYGKLYLPHYGPFDGVAHNDPPPPLTDP